MKRGALESRFGVLVLAALTGACGPAAPKAENASHPITARTDVRTAKDRPPLVVIAREGDPAAAVGFAVTTAGDADDTETAVALAGVVEHRLASERAAGREAEVIPSSDGFRGSIVVANATEAERAATAIRLALTTPIGEPDLAAAKKKLAALAARPLPDPALLRFARCTGAPYGTPTTASSSAKLDLGALERARASAVSLPRVSVAAVGPPAIADSVFTTLSHGPAWKAIATAAPATPTDALDVAIYEATAEAAPHRGAREAHTTIHVTLDLAGGAAAVALAEALGEPSGPLAIRLGDLDLPLRVRELTATSHVAGGCVGVVLEAAPDLKSAGSASADRVDPARSSDLASRVGDALALVQLEAEASLADLPIRDGHRLAERLGDAREAAEHAAWWLLGPATLASGKLAGSAAVGLARRSPEAGALDATRAAIAKAVTRARAEWQKPVVSARSRTEAGQGELWALVASPCGTDSESDADAGLSALFVTAAAEVSPNDRDLRLEPWIAADGVGVVAHGPAHDGESHAAHARRIAGAAARAFGSEPLRPSALAHARATLLRRDPRSSGALFTLASALAPQHPSWVFPLGGDAAVARASDAAITARAHTLRSAPLRVGLLAAHAAQTGAAEAAVDRWIPRHAGERACATPAAAPPPRPGTYAAPFVPGSEPEAYLAFPFPPGDEAARAAAEVIVAALDGEGGLLDRAIGHGGATPLAREASAKIVGWPRAPAIALRVVAPQAGLDAVVMQLRALVDRIQKAGLEPTAFDRASSLVARRETTALLPPRARLVSTWRGEDARGRATADVVRAFAAKSLAEDAMVVVAARPPRPPTTPDASSPKAP